MALSLQTNIIIINIVFTVVAVICVLLRLWSRLSLKTGVKADDYLIIAAVIVVVGLAVNDIYLVIYGSIGAHLRWTKEGIPLFEHDYTLKVIAKAGLSSTLLPIGSVTLTKASILLFYRRIFRGSIFSAINWTLLGLVWAWAVAFFCVVLFQCTPVDLAWASDLTTQTGGHCVQLDKVYYAEAISNMIIDIMILATPIPHVCRLQMAAKQKAMVCGIFLLGALVCGFSIARIYYFFYIGTNQDAHPDFTYFTAPVYYWSFLESAIGILAACLPTLQPALTVHTPQLIRKWTSKLSSRSSKSLLQLKDDTRSYSGRESERKLSLGASSNPTSSSVHAVHLSDLETQDQTTPPVPGINVATYVSQKESV